MGDINYIISNWPKEKQDEVYAVKKFLDNQRVGFELSPSNIEHNPPEPADIWVKDINKKFQVVVADFQHYEMAGKIKHDSRGSKTINMPVRNKEDVLREFVIKPLQKKNKYGKAAKGITLLINPPFDPPWIERDVETQKKFGYNCILSKLGFDKIYMVYRNKNVLIYP